MSPNSPHKCGTIALTSGLLAFSLACSASLNLTATTTPIPAQTPLPTDTPQPTLTPTSRYTEQEQEALVEWCKAFGDVYYGVDEVRADVQEWIESQGTAVTEDDVQKAQEFADRFSALYRQAGELERLPMVREINDMLAEATFAEQMAYNHLYRAYVTSDAEQYDLYLQRKREAEESSSAIIDRFNDLMLEMDISPASCRPEPT